MADVPVGYHWHVNASLVHHAGDGSPWCRLAHGVVRPARAVDATNAPELTRLRLVLMVNTCRLTEAGVFTPNAPTRTTQQPDDACRPARPVLQLLYVRYLAARPVDEIHCVAQTLHRDLCTHTVLTWDGLAGLWKLVTATSARSQLVPSVDVMALYDLPCLPYAEQLRCHRQRCPRHAAALTASDLALTDWARFDPLIHQGTRTLIFALTFVGHTMAAIRGRQHSGERATCRRDHPGQAGHQGRASQGLPSRTARGQR